MSALLTFGVCLENETTIFTNIWGDNSCTEFFFSNIRKKNYTLLDLYIHVIVETYINDRVTNKKSFHSKLSLVSLVKLIKTDMNVLSGIAEKDKQKVKVCFYSSRSLAWFCKY